ncbi:phage holin family protein [Pelomonas sp. Root1237]|uniref:phage holin family protein n=1 Tax=Pelomonas sp. Root1237 TaxID=1736434 RepID=UPI001F3510C8|nr:phage holin family protein [Pelomonas sp. Root1237]
MADSPQDQPAPLLEQLQSLWRELPGLVSDRVELLSLELQRAVQALAQIVALMVAVAILGVTVWLVLWAGVIRLLVAAGLPLEVALLLAIAVNGLAIVLALQRVRSLLPRLRLPATRRHLMLAPDPQPNEASDERAAA